MTLDFSRCRLAPFAHQREDVAALIAHPFYFLGSEMRTGKSKIVVDAAQFMFEAETIDRVIVVAPAPVRDVWFDRELGEIAKHAWSGLPMRATEFHARVRAWSQGEFGPGDRRLEWTVTNFEFIRSRARIAQLRRLCGHRTLLVLDESSFVKNHAAQQTKACLELRRECGRVVLLNGTPIFHSPMDLFSQGNILHPSILDCKYVTHFKARYAVQVPVMSHRVGKDGRALPLLDKWNRPILTVDKWTNLDDLQRRFAPCTVRRLQKDCLDLPPKLDPVTLTATLDETTWKVYKEMRDEMVVWLKSGKVVTSATAAVKALRLSQITGGFLGGAEDANVGEGIVDFEGLSVSNALSRVADVVGLKGPLEVGREKLDVLLWFIGQRLEADPNLHLVAWCRFRAELSRMADEVRAAFPRFEVVTIHGGQKRTERLHALSLLKPETSPEGPVFVGGTYGTGSFGLDMTAAHTSVSMSSGYSPGRFAQSADRVYGPGQRHPIAYFDVIAAGPKGQRTIDHAIVAARRAGQDVATWTTDAWVKALAEE